MTARRNKDKSPVSEEMAHEVLIEDSGNADQGEDSSHGDDSERSLRRPPEPAETKGIWSHIEQTARIAASIGVAGAAIVGVIEYISANEDIRRERSLAIVRDWQEAGQIDRYTRIQSFVEDQLEKTTPLPASLPPELLARAYQNLGYNWMTDLRKQGGPEAVAIEKDVDRLTLFFGQMETCISSDLCNAEVLQAYFDSEVSSFWGYFQGYAQLRREANYAYYGAPVTDLVDRFKDMSTK